ncbi:hypothetical protein C0J52_20707 [Blattella germanica]|nr:hypothetical protein C0J52_20707 [Blattella germanica]
MLRKNYLPPLYDSTLESICPDIGGNYIWISVDKTSDSCHRCVTKFVVGKLHPDTRERPHLLACKMLGKTNYSTIARFVNDFLRLLWPSKGNIPITAPFRN